MFFNDWKDLLHVLVVGSLVYAGLIVCLRISGKRTLSKWNAFDFIVTIALGSTLASAFLSKTVAVAEGLFAVVVLVGLQFAITWLSVRVPAVRRIVKSQPTLLLDQGVFLEPALLAQRVTHSEIRAAVRAAGCGALEDVGAVVLETDGSFSVILRSREGSRSALEDVGQAGKTDKAGNW